MHDRSIIWVNLIGIALSALELPARALVNIYRNAATLRVLCCKNMLVFLSVYSDHW